MDLEIRHLKVVCAIADTGSVTKAAALLGLAQPALTAQLQRIERRLGGPLFDRDRRGARPTALGELVLARARVLLGAMKGLQDEAARLAGGTGLPGYRFGSVNSPILGGVVHRLAAERPAAPVSTYGSWSAEELARMVLGGRLDFVLCGTCGGSTPSAEPGMVWRAVSVDPVFVMLPEPHPLAARAEVDLADLATEQWAVARGDGCFGDCFVGACVRAGFTPRTIYESDSRGCLELVACGEAIGLCQAATRPVAGLTARPLAGAPLQWRLMLGWYADGPAAAVADLVFRHAVAAYGELLARNGPYAAWLRDHPGFGAQDSAPEPAAVAP